MLAMVSARDAASLHALIRPLPHYGRQSYVIFDGAKATRRGAWFKFILYWCELEGISFPMGQGKYVAPDFKARVLQPPYNTTGTNAQPWRFDLIN